MRAYQMFFRILSFLLLSMPCLMAAAETSQDFSASAGPSAKRLCREGAHQSEEAPSAFLDSAAAVEPFSPPQMIRLGLVSQPGEDQKNMFLNNLKDGGVLFTSEAPTLQDQDVSSILRVTPDAARTIVAEACIRAGINLCAYRALDLTDVPEDQQRAAQSQKNEGVWYWWAQHTLAKNAAKNLRICFESLRYADAGRRDKLGLFKLDGYPSLPFAALQNCLQPTALIILDPETPTLTIYRGLPLKNVGDVLSVYNAAFTWDDPLYQNLLPHLSPTH